MKDFSKSYFTMKESDTIDYSKSMLHFFDEGEDVVSKEIGDGNLNFVFKVVGQKSGKSLILKQAGPVARISSDFKISPDRNRIESELLRIEYTLAPGLAPKVYKYDHIMNCFAMEDLSDHEIMRTALIEHKKFPRFVDDITTFLVNTLLLTTDVVVGHKEKKDMVKKFINPELCEITEDLVYTEPFYDCPRNDIFEATRGFVKAEIWSDETLARETAKLKFEFMNNAQSLIHGDLHTGSIFVRQDSTKVIDPEFGFFGPAGYDVGNVVANLIFAFENAEATIENAKEKDDYKSWLEQTTVDVVDLFKKKFIKTWNDNAKEHVARYKGFDEYYLNTVIRDTVAVAGCELNRRIIGLAHVKDITSISDPQMRARAEKVCIASGKRLILNRESIKEGKDIMDIVKDFESKIR